MAYEYNVNWYYKKIYEDLFDDYITYLNNENDTNFNENDTNFCEPVSLKPNINLDPVKCIYEKTKCNYNELLPKEFIISYNLWLNKDQSDLKYNNNHSLLFHLFDKFRQQFSSFLDYNRYNIAFLYTSKKLEQYTRFKIRNKRVWTNYYWSDLYIDSELDNSLFRFIYSPDDYVMLNQFCRLVDNPKFLEGFDRIIDDIDKLWSLQVKDEYSKKEEQIISKMVTLMTAIGKISDQRKIKEYCKKFLKFLSSIHNSYTISTNDIKPILETVFKTNKILEILFYKRIVNLGFPSIPNLIFFNEEGAKHEVDILTFTSDCNTDCNIKIIEVTAGTLSWNYINKKKNTLDFLKSELDANIKTIIIYGGRKCYCEKLDDLHLVSIEDIFTNYPSRLLQELYY